MYFSKFFNTVKKEISKVKEIQIKRAARVKGSRFPASGAKLKITLHMFSAVWAILVCFLFASKSDVQWVGLFLAVDNVQ